MKITAGAISAEARKRRLSKTSAPRLLRPRSATATTHCLRVAAGGADLSKLRPPAMAEIALEKLTKVYPDGTHAVRELDLADRGRRADRPRRAVGLRQDDGAADGRRARGHHRRIGPDRRARREQPAAEGPRRRDGLPELRALPAHDGVRQHGVRAEDALGPERRRSTGASDDAAQVLGLEQVLSKKPRTLSGGQRQRVAMGRAIVREPQAFLMDEPLSNLDAKLRVRDARRDRAHPAGPRRDDDLRHARPGRGDDARRPGRRHARRPPAAGRRADRSSTSGR